MLISIWSFLQALILWGAQLNEGAIEFLPVKNDITKAQFIKFDVGYYRKLNVLGKTEAPDSDAGYRTISEAEFINATTVIEPELGYGIGFKYAIKAPEKFVSVDLEIVGVHPKMINKKGKEVTTQSYRERLYFEDGIAGGTVLYWFSQPYEMVSGNWNFTIKNNDNVLFSQNFYVSEGSSKANP